MGGGQLLEVTPSPEALPYAPYVLGFCLTLLVRLLSLDSEKLSLCSQGYHPGASCLPSLLLHLRVHPWLAVLSLCLLQLLCALSIPALMAASAFGP